MPGSPPVLQEGDPRLDTQGVVLEGLPLGRGEGWQGGVQLLQARTPPLILWHGLQQAPTSLV